MNVGQNEHDDPQNSADDLRSKERLVHAWPGFVTICLDVVSIPAVATHIQVISYDKRTRQADDGSEKVENH